MVKLCAEHRVKGIEDSKNHLNLLCTMSLEFIASYMGLLGGAALAINKLLVQAECHFLCSPSERLGTRMAFSTEAFKAEDESEDCFFCEKGFGQGPDATGVRPLGATPTGVERCSPQFTVPAPPRCPQEAVLPTPHPWSRGAAVSSEHMAQCHHDTVSNSHPLRGVQKQSVRLFPARMLQVTEVAVTITSEASLERLVPLVDVLTEWKNLPNISPWVLQIIERGYRIQFRSPPPRYNGVLLVLVHPEQALVMEQEVESLLVKGAIEQVYSPDRESGFYSATLLFRKRMGGGCVPF